MTACIVGWAHTRFGKLEGETLEGLITRVQIEGNVSVPTDQIRAKLPSLAGRVPGAYRWPEGATV